MSRVDFSDPSGVHRNPVGSVGPAGGFRRSEPSLPSSQPGHSAGPGLAHANARSSSAGLRGLSDRELLSKVKALVAQERATTLEILVHLIEVERRRLHLGLGYPSIFEYCVRHLGYSKSAAGRRIHAARCIRDYPEVYGLLEQNELNLVTVSLVASILTDANAKELIGRIRGKSQGEVEEIVARYRPPVAMRDRAKPVCVAVSAPDDLPLNRPRGESTPTSGSEISPNLTAVGGAGGQPQVSTESQALLRSNARPSDKHPTSPTPRLEQKFLIQFLASGAFKKKLERAQALLSNKLGKPSYEAVLEAALDEFLKDHDPEKREQRRKERRQGAGAKMNSPSCARTAAVRQRLAKLGGGDVSSRWGGEAARGPADGDAVAPRIDSDTARRIPAAARDAVFARDKGRCTYVGSNGVRCAATHRLQIDHVIPYARGGTNAAQNLRLLCERHNKLEAERVYGKGVMNSFRARQ